MSDVKLLGSRPVFDGRVVKLSVDRVQLPNGNSCELEMIRHPGAAAVVPVRTGARPVGAAPIGIGVDPTRAIATCLKPADMAEDGGVILRLHETAGRAGPVDVRVRGLAKATRSDLLERDLADLPVADGAVRVDLPAHGLAAVRLAR